MNNLDNICSQHRTQLLYFISQLERSTEDMKELKQVQEDAKAFATTLLNLIIKLNK